MSWKNSDDISSKADIKEGQLSTLPKGDSIDSARIQAWGGSCPKDIPQLAKGCFGELKGILPTVDITGFDQEAPDHTTSDFKRLMHKIGSALGFKGETLADEVRDKVVHDLKKTPPGHSEADQYKEEQKKLDQYKEDVKHWAMQDNFNAKYPEAPNCPMHDEVDRRVQRAEQKIVSEVRLHMTGGELKRLAEETKEYEKAQHDANHIDPYGTGGLHRRQPQPGEAIKDYWYRLKVATEVSTGH